VPVDGAAPVEGSAPVDPEPGPLDGKLIGLVGIGGAVGTGIRYGLTQWLPTTHGWPWPTLTANLIGTFILGALLALLAEALDGHPARRARLLIGTGFCGGLTTYSTLVVEADLLVRAHRFGLATTYAVVSLVAGLAVAGLGIAMTTLARRRPG
jgi:CrcB protein